MDLDLGMDLGCSHFISKVSKYLSPSKNKHIYTSRVFFRHIKNFRSFSLDQNSAIVTRSLTIVYTYPYFVEDKHIPYQVISYLCFQDRFILGVRKERGKMTPKTRWKQLIMRKHNKIRNLQF